MWDFPLHWAMTARQPELADTFRKWRESFGLSQEQLAEQSKIKLRFIQRIEASKLELRSRALKVLDFEIAWKKKYGALPGEQKNTKSPSRRPNARNKAVQTP